MSTPLQSAISDWRSALGEHSVIAQGAALHTYGQDTSDYSAPPAVVLRPCNLEQVHHVVRIASAHKVPLHPISSGNNWGYGSANAYTPGCAVVDLSTMDSIVHFDEEIGLITIEPGVTQGKLRAWLDARGLDFMVPTTGAGPTCSLVGNALERGYGLTPYADHFSAVVSLEAVLPDGSLYQSPLGTGPLSSGFKWGIGPYLDGLFTQGNIGIVTSMTLALSRRPRVVETFYFWVNDDSDLEEVVTRVRGCLREAGSNIGGINLISAARFLAMSDTSSREAGRYPRPLKAIEHEAREAGGAAWMGVGAIYGTEGHAAATRRLVKIQIGPVAKRIAFFSLKKIRLIERILKWLPGKKSRQLLGTTKLMKEGLDLLEGRPGEVALPLAYTGSGTPQDSQMYRNPARDGCGLLWYAPIIPMTPVDARRFIQMARDICTKHGFEAPLTLSSLSDRSFDCTLPILFDRRDGQMCSSADACWRDLCNSGRKLGFVPYRVHARYGLQFAADDRNAFWEVARRVKEAIDPKHIISPGRWHEDPSAQDSN